MQGALVKQQVLKELQKIPGIGKACAKDLWDIGIKKISDLENQNPQVLYTKLNTITGIKHDICMLYTFRCAVYFATEKCHELEKLHWWYWKDNIYNE